MGLKIPNRLGKMPENLCFSDSPCSDTDTAVAGSADTDVPVLSGAGLRELRLGIRLCDERGRRPVPEEVRSTR